MAARPRVIAAGGPKPEAEGHKSYHNDNNDDDDNDDNDDNTYLYT